jgi:hypothetical protein
MLYFGRAAARGLRTSPVTTAVAVVTIGVSLVLVGAFQLLVRNMEELLDDFGDDLQVTAYLQEGLVGTARDDLESVIRTVEGVAGVRSVSKEEALERFRAGVGAGAALLEGLDENPLPASLEIELLAEVFSEAVGGRLHNLSAGRWVSPLGEAVEQTWAVEGSALNVRAILIPICEGTGSLVFLEAFADAYARRVLDGWLASFRWIQGAAPPVCQRLNPR